MIAKKIGIAGVAVFLLAFNAHANADIETVMGSRLDVPLMILAGDAKVLGGDAGLACEMLLCLAATTVVPSACKRPLKKYFSLKPKRRAGFLAKCPKVSS